MHELSTHAAMGVFPLCYPSKDFQVSVKITHPSSLVITDFICDKTTHVPDFFDCQ